MVRLIFASLASKRQKEQTKWQIQKLCRSFSPLLRVHFCWQSSECVNLLLLEFPKTVRKCWLVERLDLLPMAVLLTFHADCSLVVLKPAHSSCLLPVASPFFRNAGSWNAHSGGSRGIVGAVKDYERKVQTSETLIEVAMIRLLVVRLGRWA